MISFTQYKNFHFILKFIIYSTEQHDSTFLKQSSCSLGPTNLPTLRKLKPSIRKHSLCHTSLKDQCLW